MRHVGYGRLRLSLELRQMLSERETAARYFDKGEHDKHSDDKREYRSKGFLGHGGLAEGLTIYQGRPGTNRMHMPFVTMALSSVPQDEISSLTIESSGNEMIDGSKEIG